jgi:hypothetical protein
MGLCSYFSHDGPKLVFLAVLLAVHVGAFHALRYLKNFPPHKSNACIHSRNAMSHSRVYLYKHTYTHTHTLFCRHGDHVTTMKKASYNNHVSAWTPLVAKDTPLFGVDRVVELYPLKNAKGLKKDYEFKLRFSFLEGKFLTPWITVRSKTGEQLRAVQFDFLYIGDYVTGMKWQIEYRDPPAEGGGSAQTVQDEKFMSIRYHWHKDGEVDSAFGFTVFLIMSVLSAIAGGINVIGGCDSYRTVNTIELEEKRRKEAARNKLDKDDRDD